MECKRQLCLLILLTTTGVLTLMSCKKDVTKSSPLASLCVTNAIVGGSTALLGSNTTPLSNNNYAEFPLNTGSNNIYIYPSLDSLHPYYVDSKFIINPNDAYSLFLTGTNTAVDAVLVKDTIPYWRDSTAGIRFINLSPNTSGKAINVTLSTTPTVNEAFNLAYKQYTGFKSYLGLYNSTYTFEIRNDTSASPKKPLTTFTLASSAVPRFSNITLVIRQNGTNLSVFRVNNDR